MAKKDAKVRQVKESTLAAQTAQSPTTATTTTTDNSTSTTQLSFFNELVNSLQISYTSYLKTVKNDQRLKLIDCFLVFLVILGVFQFIFCVLMGNFPFNAFLGGFISTVGQFVLTVSLRLQSLDENATLFKGISPERAFGDYIFASLILHFVVLHFIN
ncbi:hypothetical protein CANARDRAFT_176476 [[Candida] arabinofermentans NRRL YB-2248]|uniref:Dolichyl-diphosphooligosaccharide--protein glycosyltransferase subunit OST2 n=1 Tax=[Candida] arabinofermentans NRRL YB-2248 TaxID=983967 RepID=A0A1E4SZZ6_9ASCO|nr:hypothetical protein CANARDRAFT_176476 [[Candida] arabinofermentans NRRL YB-2248]